jgi:hypothetical protein
MTLKAYDGRPGNSRHRTFRGPETVLIVAAQLIYVLRSMRVSSTEHAAVCYREGATKNVA